MPNAHTQTLPSLSFSKVPILFLYGYTLSSLLLLLQTESRSLTLRKESYWIPFLCGFAGILMCWAVPLLDWFQGIRIKRDPSHLLRCIGGFIGVNYAVCSFHGVQDAQLAVTLGILGIGLWFLFDRTLHGFLVGFVVAAVGTCFVSFLVRMDVYRCVFFPKTYLKSFRQSGFYGVPLWLPPVLYSSSILSGSVGRHLDLVPEHWYSV